MHKAGVRGRLAGFHAALSAGTMPAPGAPSPYFAGPGGTLRERFPADRLPRWLGETELDPLSEEFECTRSSGAPARHRAADRDREDLAAYDGVSPAHPSLCVGGELDASTPWMADAIDAFPVTLPGLVSSHILKGCGHQGRQERPEDTDRPLTDRLAALAPATC